MKNYSYLSVILMLLSLGFLIFSLAVWVSGGKSKFFVNKKLKIGALIIGLTGMLNACKPPVVTCYKVAVEPIIVPMQQTTGAGIKLESGFSTVDFDCDMLFYDFISYRISNINGIVEFGDCELIRDSTSLILRVKPASNIPIGDYNLGLYYGKYNEIGGAQTPFSEFKVVVNE